MYADMNSGDVLYFDSYGIAPEKRVRKLMRSITNAITKVNPSATIRSAYNKIRHQYENSECGVYSINFIIRMLKGDSFDKICNDKVPDREINKCRAQYFINT
jgi:Ulp1 family protease